MTSPPSFSFSKPAMPGDAVSVLVLVEDSAGMATKWPDVRDSYLPNLLDKLRSEDPSVQVRPVSNPPFVAHGFAFQLDGSSVAHNILASVGVALACTHHGRCASPSDARASARTGCFRETVPNEHLERNWRTPSPVSAPLEVCSLRHLGPLLGQPAAKHHEASHPRSSHWSADTRRPKRRRSLRFRLLG